MEFAIPGFIKRFCTPNALLTLMEYVTDYASEATRAAAERLISAEAGKLEPKTRQEVEKRLETIRTTDERDSYF